MTPGTILMVVVLGAVFIYGFYRARKKKKTRGVSA